MGFDSTSEPLERSLADGLSRAIRRGTPAGVAKRRGIGAKHFATIRSYHSILAK